MRLYAAGLDVDDSELARLRATLSVDERAAADALGLAVQRRRAVAERGYRRAVLAAELACEPAAIEYVVDSRRKPHLAGGRLEFSASRAGAVALYAVSESAVGVDVEEVGEPAGGELRRLAARVLTPREHAAWEAVPAVDRAAALSACWTRKEAHGKALGTGLVFPLDDVELWAGDDRPVHRGEIVVQAVDLGSVLVGLSSAADPTGAARTVGAGVGGHSLTAAVAVRIVAGRRAAVRPPAPVARIGE